MKFTKQAVRSAAMALILGITTLCHAQFSGNVQGTVSDKTGAVVVNAKVTLHNVENGIDLTDTTNSSGAYHFTGVGPGNYEVQVTAPGFKVSNVAVAVSTQEMRGVDVTLSVGTSSDVKVNSVAQAINPDETRVETTLTSDQISKLPLPNKDPQFLIALTPGVTGYQNENPSSGYGNSIFAPSFNPPYHANGASTAGNLYLIDDLPVMDTVNTGQALILPNADMIQEIALQTQTYSVENGTAASIQTNFLTKAGSNRFHGDVDYFYSSSNFGTATQPSFSPGLPGQVATFHENQLLASLGGPIIKDRTFFFGSVQKQLSAIGGVSTVQNFFTPDFAAWALKQFPNSPAAYALNLAPGTRVKPDPTQIVLANALGSGIGAGCGSTQTDANSAETYNIPCDLPVLYNDGTFNQGQPFDGLEWNIRLDQALREAKDRLYVMYTRIDQTLGNLSPRPFFDGITPSQNKYITASWSHIFSSNLLNDLHAGNIRTIGGSTFNDGRVNSIPVAPLGLDFSLGPQCCFTQYYGYMPYAGSFDKVHSYTVRDTVSYNLHNHNLRAAYQFYRDDTFDDTSQLYGRPFSPFYFGGNVISFIANTQSAGYNLFTIGGNGLYNPQRYGATSIYNGAFVEDNWRVRSNLTLTLGLRYDSFGNPVQYGATTQPFVPLFLGSGSTVQEQVLNLSTKLSPNAFSQGQNLNFMPRGGFAYTPTANKKLLLKGGIGFYEDAPTAYQIASNLPTQPPNRNSLYINGVVPYGDFKTLTAPFGYNLGNFPSYGIAPWGAIYSNAAQTSVYNANLNGYSRTLKPQKAVNYSVGIEQQFADNFVFGLSYVGSYSFDLIEGASGDGAGGGTKSDAGSNSDWNLMSGSPGARPTNHWGQIQYGDNSVSGNYNALLVTARQSYRGLDYVASYNFSKALQYAPVSFDPNGHAYYLWTSPAAPHSIYGPSAFDVRNSFSLGGGYEVPKFFSNNLMNELTQWRFSTIAIAQTGSPFTVFNTNGTDYQNNGGPSIDGTSTGVYGYPDYTGKQHGFSRSQMRAGVFGSPVKASGATQSPAVAAFPNPEGTGTTAVIGNQGPNSFYNPAFIDVDVSVSKGFTIPSPYTNGEGVKFFLRGEAINVFNRTNYNTIDNDVNDGTFGQVTSAEQKRYLQLGGRLEF
jgi:hypothetical protein